MSNDVFIKLLESARELRQQRVRRLTRLARAVGGRPRPRSETGIDVRAIRAATGLSQSKFAELLSIEVSTLRNWEQGWANPPVPPEHCCAPSATIRSRSSALSPTEPGHTMTTINRTTVTDLRGAARLAFDATLGITTLVEKMHHTIQLVHPPLGASRAESTRSLTGLIYKTIRGTTRVIGKGLDAGLTPLAAFLPEGETTAGRNAWVSAINGVYGGHLDARPILSIEMGFLHEGDFVDPERPGNVVRDASGKVLLAIHGLCLNEQHSIRDGHHRIANVATATDHTIIHLRYNSGRSIDANGRSLAQSLEALLAHWPVPVSHLVIVGHSMGGLVARSAMHHGTVSGIRGGDNSVSCSRSARLTTAHRSNAAATVSTTSWN